MFHLFSSHRKTNSGVSTSVVREKPVSSSASSTVVATARSSQNLPVSKTTTMTTNGSGDTPTNAQGNAPASHTTFVKVAVIGDLNGVGKSSLLTRFHDDRFSEEYLPTRAINVVEKRIHLEASNDVVFSLWEVANDESEREMFPLALDDAAAVIIVFDLTRRTSLAPVKDTYRRVRRMNSAAPCLLVGAKFDLFLDLDASDQTETTELARLCAKSMGAPLVYTSASHSINVQKVFKILLGCVFGIDCKVTRVMEEGEPLIEF